MCNCAGQPLPACWGGIHTSCSHVAFKHKQLVCLCITVSRRGQPREAKPHSALLFLPLLLPFAIQSHNLLYSAHATHSEGKKIKVLLVVGRKTNIILCIKLCRASSAWQSPKHHSYSHSSSASTEGGIN